MKKIFIFLIVTVMLFACKKEKDCLNYSSKTGLIINEQSMGECYSLMANDKYLITDTIAYKQLPSSTIDSIQLDLGCSDNPTRPDIDFDAYALLGAKTLAKGCIVTYSRDVAYDNNTKTLQYNIDVHQCGNCDESRYNMNWILIQKIDSIASFNIDINYHLESN